MLLEATCRTQVTSCTRSTGRSINTIAESVDTVAVIAHGLFLLPPLLLHHHHHHHLSWTAAACLLGHVCVHGMKKLLRVVHLLLLLLLLLWY
jgi:hypothetical protein